MSTARRVHHLTGISSPWFQGRNSSARGAIATYAFSEAAVAVLTIAAIVAVTVAVAMSSRTTNFEQKTVEDSRSSQGMRKEEDSQITEELEAILPSDLQEALLTFDGDFRGPWLALGLEADADLHRMKSAEHIGRQSALNILMLLTSPMQMSALSGFARPMPYSRMVEVASCFWRQLPRTPPASTS